MKNGDHREKTVKSKTGWGSRKEGEQKLWAGLGREHSALSPVPNTMRTWNREQVLEVSPSRLSRPLKQPALCLGFSYLLFSCGFLGHVHRTSVSCERIAQGFWGALLNGKWK